MSADVPELYQPLFGQIQQLIGNAGASISKSWDGSRYPVAFSSWILSANSNNGAAIMGAGFSLAGAMHEVDAARSLGVQAVTVEIGYPILDGDFYASLGRDPDLAGRFLGYYQSLVQYVHGKGMKLIVETNPLLTVSIAAAGSALDPTGFYKSLSLDQYERGRSAHNAVIAQQVRPDYLVLQSEPDTEVRDVQNPAIGAVIGDPTRDVEMISAFVSALDQAQIPGLHSSIQVGAGASSWLPNWEAYNRGFASIAGLDLLDAHLYNLQPTLDEVNRIARIADIAHGANKQIGMSEFWANKSLTSSESIFDIRVRDDFSFWAPLDQQMLQLMTSLANWKHFEYLTPTGWLNMYTYLDYASLPCTLVYPTAMPSPNRNCDDQLQALQIRQAGVALNSGGTSATGQAYRALIAENSK